MQMVLAMYFWIATQTRSLHEHCPYMQLRTCTLFGSVSLQAIAQVCARWKRGPASRTADTTGYTTTALNAFECVNGSCHLLVELHGVSACSMQSNVCIYYRSLHAEVESSV